MEDIADKIQRWETSLYERLELGGLYSREPVAHKWKAPFRSLVIRETSLWRLHDLMRQSYKLHQEDMTLGARILLRSGFETAAVLVYLNSQMRGVIDGSIDFHDFSATTSRLLLGSKDSSTSHQAVNVLTTLRSVERSYPGLEAVFASLSESAHPNWEGMGYGYSRIDRAQDVAHLSNNMGEMFRASHISGMNLCMSMYEHEYNDVWTGRFEELESYLVRNDENLEATRRHGV